MDTKSKKSCKGYFKQLIVSLKVGRQSVKGSQVNCNIKYPRPVPAGGTGILG